MTEIQVYGKDGLFHSIVKASKIMAGRYAIIPGTPDLNRNNVLTGIEFPRHGKDFKYPMVACVTPVSAFTEASVNGQWEVFNFTLFFIATTYNSGDNRLKQPDPLTNSSLHTSPKDWSDMKQVMMGFMGKLETAAKSIRNGFRLDQKGSWVVRRFSNYQNDNLSGVYISFSASLPGVCEWPDIDNDKFTMPIFSSDPHPQHFH